jgi:hypothetical protein
MILFAENNFELIPGTKKKNTGLRTKARFSP